MPENKLPTINSSLVEGRYQIELANCEVKINSRTLSIMGLPTIQMETALREKRILIGNSTREGLSIDLGNAIIQNLSLVCCVVTFDNQEMRFSGSLICFDHCNLDGLFSYKSRSFKVDNSSSGDLCLFSDFGVSAENLKFTVQDVSINCGTGNTIKLDIPPNNQQIVATGKCISLSSSTGLRVLTFGGHFSADFLSFTNSIILSGLQAQKNSLIKRDNDTFELRVITELSGLSFNNITIKLLVENVDLSKTRLTFEKNAALDFGALKSIASTWEPDMINYRGFSSSGLLSKEKVKEINPLPAREFFCEMKTHFNSKGDSISAGEFYVAEMKAHRAHLRKSKFLFHRDRITMFFSFWSSKFGQNWVWALGWYILIGGLVGWLLIYESLQVCCFDIVRFYSNIYSPLTIDFDHIKLGLPISSWYAFLWIIWKIIAGFLIYQIIISNRRFIRKW